MIFFEFETDQTDQKIHETIEGVPVTVRILWNERFKYWTMTVYNRQQEAIISGVKLVRDYPLTSVFRLDEYSGDFVFIRTNGDKDEATVESIGRDFQLVYLTRAELDVMG